MKRAKTNPQLVQLITRLRERSRVSEVELWRDVAARLERPRRISGEVNLSTLERHLRDGETALVPGKVLASGEVKRPLSVAAVSFSAAARKKILAARGKPLTLDELMSSNPEGRNIHILQ